MYKKYRKVRRLLSLMLVTSMLATSAVPAMATDSNSDVDTGSQIEASDDTALSSDTGNTDIDTSGSDGEGVGNDLPTDPTDGEAADESGEGPDGTDPADETEESEDGSDVPDSKPGNEQGRADGEYDPQPEELEEVQEWIDHYVDSDYAETEKPYWEYEVDAYLIPEGWECIFVDDDVYFGASYYTLRSLYPGEDGDGDGDEDGNEAEEIVITTADVTVLLGDEDFDLLEGVSATDGNGEDISSQIVLYSDGGFDVGELGEYRVVYAILDDEAEIITAALRVVTVAEELPATAELTAEDLYLLIDTVDEELGVGYYTYADGAFLEGVAAYDAEGNDITDLVEITSYGGFGEAPAEGDLLLMGQYTIELAAIQDGEVLAEGSRKITIGTGIMPLPGEITYTVNWYDWDGTLIISQPDLKPGDTAAAPPMSGLDNYTYEGWILLGDDGEDIKYTNDQVAALVASVNEDMNFQVWYEPMKTKLITIEYLLLLNPDRDPGEAEKTIPFATSFVGEYPVADGRELKIKSPDREGYTIQDGNEHAVIEDGQHYIVIDLDEYTENLTVSVYYVAEEGSVTIYYQQEKPDGSGYEPVTEDTVFKSGRVGDEVIIPVKTYPGFEQSTFPNNVTIQPGTNEPVYVNFDRLSYAMYFETDGGTYFAPFSVKYGTDISALLPVVPVEGEEHPDFWRRGYYFDGWIITPNGADDDWNDGSTLPTTMPPTDVTATATWRAQDEVSYSVVYWLERADYSETLLDDERNPDGSFDRGYDYVDTLTFTGAIGAPADIPPHDPDNTLGIDWPYANLFNHIDYEGNPIDHAYRNEELTAASDGLTINADGSTVVNVFYDRTIHVLKMDPLTSNATYKYSWVIDGIDYASAGHEYIIKAKYGDYMANQWPATLPSQTVVQTNTVTYPTTWNNPRDEYSASSKRANMLGDVTWGTEDNPQVITASYGTGTEQTLYYMKQPIGAPRSVGRDDYLEDEDLTQTSNGSGSWSSKELLGFSHQPRTGGIDGPNPEYHADENGVANKVVKFFYWRDRYTLTFKNGTETWAQIDDSDQDDDPDDPHGVHYQMPLKGYDKLPEVAITNDDAPDEYQGWNFVGWGTADGELFDFETELMPPGNLILHALWEQPSNPVNFYIVGDDGTPEKYIPEQMIPLRETVDEPTPPTKAEYEFIGWYENPDPGPTDVRYVFDFPVDRELELFAVFRYKTDVKYTVEYYRDNYDGEPLERNYGYGAVNQPITVYGFGPDKLAEHFLDGYFVDEYKKSWTILEDEAQNVIRFLYTEAESVDYTVHYLESGTERILDGPETLSESKNVVTIPYKPISGYRPQVNEIVLPLGLSGNEATFYYDAFDAEPYTVEHYFQKLDGNNRGGYPTADEIKGTQYVDTLSAPVAARVEAVPRTEAGYVVDSTVSLTKLFGYIPTAVNPEDRLVLRVFYKRDSFTMSYDSDGGSAVPAQNNVLFEQLVTKPADPVKPGYVFSGWYKDDRTTAWDFDVDTMPARNETLYARWTVRSDLMLLFDYNNADRENGPPSKLVIFNEPVGELPEPERDGYTFEGWYDESGNLYTKDTIYQVDDNTTLKAEWKAEKRTITYYPNYGTNDPTPPETVDYDSMYDLKSAADLGMTHPDYWMIFLGWTESEDGTGTLYTVPQQIIIKGDMKLYAKWGVDESIALSVTYDANGGNGGYIDPNLLPGIDYVVLANDVPPVSITKPYFDFLGWTKDEAGTGTLYQADDTFMLTESETLYAQWKHDGKTWFRITYDPGKGDGAIKQGEEKIPGEIDTVLSVTDCGYTRKGFVFDGWLGSDGETYAAGDEIVMDENITLTAQWKHDGKTYYKVTYKSNDGKNLEYKDPGIGIIPGEDDVIVAQSTTGFTMDGHYIEKWTTEPNGGGDSYVEGEFITLDDDVELYAQWKHDGKYYYVTYHSNDGKDERYTSIGIVPGDNETAIDELTSGFSKFAFVIASWNTEADGSGTRYAIGEQIPVTGDMDLYAQWEHNEKDFYNVTYYANYGANESKLGPDVIPGNTDDVLAGTIFARPYGFEFVGWNTQADGLGTSYAENEKILVDSANVELYAQWRSNGYEFYHITYDGNGGSDEDGNTQYLDDTDVIPGEKGTVLELSDTGLSRFGYSFQHWTDESGKWYYPGDKVVLNDDLTLYAVWETNDDEVYHFTYDGNGGKLSDGSPTYVVGVTPEDTINILTIGETGLTRPYYTFLGWNTRADGKGANYTPGTPYFMDGDMTLYAQWKHDGNTFFHVTYMANDRGQGGPQDGDPQYPGDLDKVWTLSQTGISARYEGWVFKGWDTEKDGTGDRYQPGEMIELNDNTTLWAHWEHDGKTFYSVGYTAGGGQGGRIDSNLLPGDPYTVKTQAQANVTHTSDWTFKNWVTSNGTSVVYNEGQLIPVLTGSLFLKAEWNYEGNEVVITYDANRGEGSHSETSVPGYNYTVVGNVTAGIYRYGHDFVQWNEEPDGSGEWYVEGTIARFTEDVTLYAQWKHDGETFVNVNYDANKGIGSKSYPVIPGEDHIVLSDSAVGVSRLGHAFVNWNGAANGGGTNYAVGSVVTPLNNDITVYAQWDYDGTTKVTLTYDANGGTGARTVGSIVPGESVTVLSNTAAGIDRYGHYFRGWTTEADGSGDAYAAGELIKVDNNTTIYAQWEWDGVTYAILDYDANGGTGSHTVSDIIPGETSVVIDPADADSKISRYGFEFQGWNTQKDGKGKSYAIGENIKVDVDTTLYAQWKHDGKTYYKVYYMPNGGTGNHIVDVVPGGEHTIVELSDTTIVRNGYEFDDWNTAATGTGTVRKPGDTITVTGPTILYAKWNQIITYQVTYEPNGGQGVRQTAPAVVAGQNDIVWTQTKSGFTRIGHSFAGWNTASGGTGTGHGENTQITMNDNMTLHAQWTWDGRTYANITYDANGGTGGGNGPSLIPGEWDKVLSPTDASLKVERMHYDFLGWNTKADGTGTTYQPGADVQLHDGMTLYAQWDWDGTYVYVIYNSNGGTDAGTIQMGLEDEEVRIKLKPGEQHTVLSAADFNFDRRGHEFLGWGKEDIETPPVVYLPGDVITVDVDEYLYASWYYDEVALVTITYDANGGTGTNTVSVVPGRSVSLRDASNHKIERKGYEFVGWALDANGPAVYTPGTGTVYFKTNNNVTLYAIWKVDDAARITVNYHANGAVGNDYADIDQRPGSSYTLLAPTANELKYSLYAYEFTGWNTQADGKGVSYSAGEAIAIEGEDIDLYAQWKHDGKTYYQIYYMPSGGSGYAIDKVIPGSSYTIRTGAESTIIKNGYVVAYWNTATNGTGTDYVGGDVITPTGHMNLYAQWVGSDVTYRVVYSPNGGRGGSVQSGISPVGRYTIRSEAQAVVSRDGYTVATWNTADNGYGDSYQPGEKIIIKGDMDLYAQWAPIEGYQFTVTYDSNGADGGTTYPGGKYTHNEKHIVVSDSAAGFTNTNYTFLYWNTRADGKGDDYVVTNEIVITEDITLYAQWEAIPQDRYITYDGNLGAGSPNKKEYNNANDPYNVQDLSYINLTSSAAYEFTGWNTAADGAGKSYDPGELLPKSGDITLYAQWKYDGYSMARITYMPNTANGGAGAPKIVSQNAGPHVLLDPDSLNYSHSGGKTFKGWSTDMTSVTGDPAGNSIAAGGNMTLYAIWGD